jgi:hypothetical protein
VSLELASVVKVYAKRRTVDLVMMKSGAPVANVQVMFGMVGTDFGSWNLPAAQPPTTEQLAGGLNPAGRSIVAVVGYMGARPVVLGFMPPKGAQVIFDQDNREVHLHPSGAYTTVAPDGSIETFHPSGAYIRIGSGGHENLAPLAADGNWVTPAGAAPATVTVATAGHTISLLPGGAATWHTVGDLTHQVDGAYTLNAAGGATINGNLQLNGEMNATGDVIAAGKSLDHHEHPTPDGESGQPNA